MPSSLPGHLASAAIAAPPIRAFNTPPFSRGPVWVPNKTGFSSTSLTTDVNAQGFCIAKTSDLCLFDAICLLGPPLRKSSGQGGRSKRDREWAHGLIDACSHGSRRACLKNRACRRRHGCRPRHNKRKAFQKRTESVEHERKGNQATTCLAAPFTKGREIRKRCDVARTPLGRRGGG